MRPKPASGSPAPTPHERAYHPCFPVPPDASALDLSRRDIGVIYVWRDGEMLNRALDPSELTDPTDLEKWWGGGVFELKAKDAEKRGWTAFAKYVFVGARKAFNTPSAAAASALASPPASAPASPSGGDTVNMMLAIIGALTPLVTALVERQDRRDELRAKEQSARDERLAKEADRRDELRREELRAQLAAQQEQTKLMVSLAQSQTGAAQVVSALERGLSLGKDIGAADVDDGADLNSLGQFMAGFQQAKQQQGPPS